MDIRTGEIETDLLPFSGVWTRRDFELLFGRGRSGNSEQNSAGESQQLIDR
jgi:hypothetical protein